MSRGTERWKRGGGALQHESAESAQVTPSHASPLTNDQSQGQKDISSFQNPSMLELDKVKISDHEEGLIYFFVNQ